MIENGKKVPFHFYFGIPSCVPATEFETAGATVGIEEIEELFQTDKLLYLSEMMNFPGVLHENPLVMQKIALAKKFNKPIDGHSPGLRGEEALNYVNAGISTDHECTTLEEAEEKIRYGMKILIREGSAARNYNALHPLIGSHPDQVMFCSDDKHPDELVKGHINLIVKRSINEHGYSLFDVLRAACYNPVLHYNLDVGLLRKGDSADFIIVDNLKNFDVKSTYIKGKLVAQQQKPLISSVKFDTPNHFICQPTTPQMFSIQSSPGHIRVIDVIEGQLFTREKLMQPLIKNNQYVSDLTRDLLKIVVVNRYEDAAPAIGFIHGFNLKRGAIASSIAHDSHNIICVGVSDEEICNALNFIIVQKGGIVATDESQHALLSLPIAGIMSDKNGYEVSASYMKVDQFAKNLGCQLKAPFMTLSFMALLVIPSLKLSDKGLFSTDQFSFVSLKT